MTGTSVAQTSRIPNAIARMAETERRYRIPLIADFLASRTKPILSSDHRRSSRFRCRRRHLRYWLPGSDQNETNEPECDKAVPVPQRKNDGIVIHQPAMCHQERSPEPVHQNETDKP